MLALCHLTDEYKYKTDYLEHHKMKSIGKYYLDTIKLKHPLLPIIERGWSVEAEDPYRESAWCWVIWIPFVRRGYAIGKWGKVVGENFLYEKLGVREISRVEGKPVGSSSEDILEW
jgi:hypothetical protein